jgi:hypothetical protein
MMNELKACPLCGNEARHIWINTFTSEKTTGCSKAGCVLYTQEIPLSIWQSRPGEAAAEQRGYERALDDVMEKLSTSPLVNPFTILINMKSDYLRQEGKNGKQS